MTERRSSPALLASFVVACISVLYMSSRDPAHAESDRTAMVRSVIVGFGQAKCAEQVMTSSLSQGCQGFVKDVASFVKKYGELRKLTYQGTVPVVPKGQLEIYRAEYAAGTLEWNVEWDGPLITSVHTNQ